MPERDTGQGHVPFPGHETGEVSARAVAPKPHRGTSRPAKAWSAYGARVRRRDTTLRAAIVRGLLRPVVAGAAFLALGAVTGLVPVAGPVGEHIDAVLGKHLGAHLDGTSLSNPVQGRIVPGTGDPLPPKQARVVERAVEESRRANLVETLVKANDCYSGENPDPGVTPRWAIVTLPGRDPALAPADVGFGIWLDGDPGQQHAFCP